jgi:hypothetical protein
MRLHWHKLAAVGMAICLLALVLHPTAVGVAALAAVVLAPVLLFGLVLVPWSLWPVADLDSHCVPAAPCRAALWQRPPPSFLP